MFCTNCGAKIVGDAKFCISCGAPAVAASPGQAAVPATPSLSRGPAEEGAPTPWDGAPGGPGWGGTLILGAAALLALAVFAVAGHFIYERFFGEEPNDRPFSQRLHADLKADQARMRRNLEKMQAETVERARKLTALNDAGLLPPTPFGAGYASMDDFKIMDEARKAGVERR